MFIEKWLPIGGYEGLYEVSNTGKVRSLDRVVLIRKRTGVISRTIIGLELKSAPAESGHLSVVLSKDGKGRTSQVHTLVLEAFVGARPGHHLEWQGRHIDGNPENNRLDNLLWGTRSENEMDKVDHGTSNRGERNRACKLTESEVLDIKKRISEGERSQSIADSYGVSRANINAIKKGRAWSWL